MPEIKGKIIQVIGPVVDIEFEATNDLGFWADIFGTEHVAKAWIFANLDQNRFFEIWNYANINEEIDET